MILNNSPHIRIKRYTKNSEFLVFLRTKDISAKTVKLLNPGYDLVVSVYGEDHLKEEITEVKGMNIIIGGLSKYHAFSKAQKENSQLLDYKYYIFLDEDLIIDNDQILRILEFSKNNNLELAHPVLNVNSYSYWKELIYDGFSTKKYYPTSIVEVMCPIFSKASLEKLLYTFEMSISSWGLDLIWPKILNTQIHLINTEHIGHYGVPDTKNGAFYKYLKKIGINPYLEKYKLQLKFRVFRSQKIAPKTVKEIIESIRSTDDKMVSPLDSLFSAKSSLNLFLNHFSLRKLHYFKHKFSLANIFVDGFLLFRHLKLKSKRYSFDFTSIANDFFTIVEINKLNTLFIGGTFEESLSFESTIKDRFPNISLKTQNGYDKNLLKKIEKQIELIKPEILVLGLGSPLQENIGFQLLENYKDSNIKIFTCGGFISQIGRTKNLNYYPKHMMKYGRFLYRIFEQRGVLKRILWDYPKSVFLIEKFGG